MLLLDSATLRILWANDDYAVRLLERPAADIIGEKYEDAAGIIAHSKVPVFRRIAETGISEHGTDYFVDLDKGSSSFRWQIHRATPEILIAIIDWD